MENLRNLNFLDLSYNKLLYLPLSMLMAQNLEYLDITRNSFRIQKYEQNNERNKIQVQSLVILSANIVLKYRFVASSKLFFSHKHTHTHTHKWKLIFVLKNVILIIF